MNATATRRRRAAAPFTVVQPTQRWRIVDGVYYRETVVRTATGELRLYGIRDAA